MANENKDLEHALTDATEDLFRYSTVGGRMEEYDCADRIDILSSVLERKKINKESLAEAAGLSSFGEAYARKRRVLRRFDIEYATSNGMLKFVLDMAYTPKEQRPSAAFAPGFEVCFRTVSKEAMQNRSLMRQRMQEAYDAANPEKAAKREAEWDQIYGLPLR